MSDTGILPKQSAPQGSGQVDPSVTEFLDIVGGGGKTGDAKPQPQQQQGAQSGYDNALKQALPVIADARKAAAVCTRAKADTDAMESAYNEAMVADGKKDGVTAAQKLQEAVQKAQAAQVAGKAELRTRYERSLGKLGDRPDRIAALAAPPAPVTQASNAATGARDLAKAAAVDAQAPDWQNADALLKDFDQKAGAVDGACLAGAGTKAAAFTNRYNVVDANKPAGKAIIGKYADYAAARKELDGRIKASDGIRAIEAACGTCETALAAFETAGAPSDQQKQQTAAAAFAKVKKIKDSALAKMSTKDKAELAMDLCANGTPADGSDELKELSRLYKKSPPDKAMLKAREQQRAAIADKVAKMPEIANLYDKKGKIDKAAWQNLIANPDAMRGLLGNIADIQADTLGIARVPVNKKPDPPEGADDDGNIEFGGYDPATNAVNLNLHEDCLDPPDEALTTILHEMFHAHQDSIVKKLKAGDIPPGDPLYATALMYMVNDIPVGYLQPDALDQKDYERQPTEIDAEYQGKLAAQQVLKQARKNAKSKK